MFLMTGQRWKYLPTSMQAAFKARPSLHRSNKKLLATQPEVLPKPLPTSYKFITMLYGSLRTSGIPRNIHIQTVNLETKADFQTIPQTSNQMMSKKETVPTSFTPPKIESHHK
jgi:hypothetical protein